MKANCNKKISQRIYPYEFPRNAAKQKFKGLNSILAERKIRRRPLKQLEHALPHDDEEVENYINECVEKKDGDRVAISLTENVYRDIDAESRNADLPLNVLANILFDSGNHLALEVLEKFSVIESAAAFAMKPSDPFSSAVMDDIAGSFPELGQFGRVKILSFFNQRFFKRYGKFVSDRNWTLLSILSHSITFRKAASILTNRHWKSFVKCIKENAVSLEVFAKVRKLDIQTSLKRMSKYLPLEIQLQWLSLEDAKADINPDPSRSYIVASQMSEVKQPTYDDRPQLTTRENIYNKDLLLRYDKPASWPASKPWPSDPTERLAEHVCYSCQSPDSCDCTPLTSPKVINPRVELHSYGSKGVGIRALQRIPKDTFLAEYVGLLQHRQYIGDPTYGLSLCGEDEDLETTLISAKRYGNWTRFLNHSCNSSTVFQHAVIGRRQRMMIKATRDIEMFEEMTIDYGDSYWKGRRFCECGEEGCELSWSWAVGKGFVDDGERL